METEVYFRTGEPRPISECPNVPLAMPPGEHQEQRNWDTKALVQPVRDIRTRANFPEQICNQIFRNITGTEKKLLYVEVTDRNSAKTKIERNLELFFHYSEFACGKCSGVRVVLDS